MDTEIKKEDLIHAVKEHPKIWDCSREQCKDRNKKCQAWQAVSSALIANFEDKDSKEKNEIRKQLQTKWRYIKDAYAKSKRKQKNVKSGSSSKSSKQYVYSKSLEFLDGLQVQREVHESLPSSDPECSGTRSEVKHALKQPRKKTKTSHVEDELIKFMRDQGKQPEEDADRQFFLSLLPDVKTMNEGQKRKLKIKIMQVIDDIKNPCTLYGNQEHVGYSSDGYHHGTPNNNNVQLQSNNMISSYNTIQYSQVNRLTTHSVSNEGQVESPDSVDSN